MNPFSTPGTSASLGFLRPLGRVFSRLQRLPVGHSVGPISKGRLASPLGRSVAESREPQCTTGLTKTEAEQLLDWLEANGYQSVEVSCDDGSYTVRYPGTKKD